MAGQLINLSTQTATNREDQTKKTTPTTSKFWNFKAESNNTATLEIYGDIVSGESWWSDDVYPKKFSDELKALGDVSDITVRINSGGGDVFAAVAIFTRLKEHAAKVTVIIDGWAASAATIIAMAGDVVKIPAAASFMIHDPTVGLLGYYSADDLAKFASELETVKSCIINAYMTKSNKTKDEIAELMSGETWYTGEDAVREGFCDELLFSPEAKPTVSNYANYTIPANIADKQTKEVSKRMEIKNVQELRNTFPELCRQLADEAVNTAVAEAVNAERKRIQDIENCALPGFETVVNAAKFEKPTSAADVAMQIIAAQKNQGDSFISARAADVDDSGMKNVSTSSAAGTGGADDIVDKAIESVFADKK